MVTIHTPPYKQSAAAQHCVAVVLSADIHTHEQICSTLQQCISESPDTKIHFQFFHAVDDLPESLSQSIDTIVTVGVQATEQVRTLIVNQWDTVNHLAIATGDLKQAKLLSDDERTLQPATAAIEVEKQCTLSMLQAAHLVKPNMRSIGMITSAGSTLYLSDDEQSRIQAYLQRRNIQATFQKADSEEHAQALLGSLMKSKQIDTLFFPEHTPSSSLLRQICEKACQYGVTICAGGPTTLVQIGPALIYGTNLYKAIAQNAFTILCNVARGVTSFAKSGVIEVARTDTLYVVMQNDVCLRQGIEQSDLRKAFAKQPDFAKVLR